jgi:hypothetical protein
MGETLILIGAVIVIAVVGISLMLYLGPKKEDVDKLLGGDLGKPASDNDKNETKSSETDG